VFNRDYGRVYVQVKLFDYVKNISTENDPVEETGSEYDAYIINKAFSLYPDTILFSNEMNMRPEIPNSRHYSYLFNSVRKRKRFTPWPKNNSSEDEKLVSKIYKYNQHKTKQVMKLLSEEQLDMLKEMYDEGGV